MKKWRDKNRVKLREWNKQYQREHPKRGFGFTHAGYLKLVEQQEGRCAICRRVPSGRGKAGTLHKDHNHKTKKPRALLCLWCNNILGFANDSQETLVRAIWYLQEHQ